MNPRLSITQPTLVTRSAFNQYQPRNGMSKPGRSRPVLKAGSEGRNGTRSRGAKAVKQLKAGPLLDYDSPATGEHVLPRLRQRSKAQISGTADTAAPARQTLPSASQGTPGTRAFQQMISPTRNPHRPRSMGNPATARARRRERREVERNVAHAHRMTAAAPATMIAGPKRYPHVSNSQRTFMRKSFAERLKRNNRLPLESLDGVPVKSARWPGTVGGIVRAIDSSAWRAMRACQHR